jgi:hypothetical protein
MVRECGRPVVDGVCDDSNTWLSFGELPFELDGVGACEFLTSLEKKVGAILSWKTLHCSIPCRHTNWCAHLYSKWSGSFVGAVNGNASVQTHSRSEASFLCGRDSDGRQTNCGCNLWYKTLPEKETSNQNNWHSLEFLQNLLQVACPSTCGRVEL